MRIPFAMLFLLMGPIVVESSELSIEQVYELMERNTKAVRSFDVNMTVERRRLFKRVPSQDGKGQIVSVSADEAAVTDFVFRQVYLKRGNGNEAKRRVEQFDPNNGKTISNEAFDGDILRTFYHSQNSGLIAWQNEWPSNKPYFPRDYLMFLRPSYLHVSLSALLKWNRATLKKDGDLLLLDGPQPPDGQNIPITNFRAWLDPAHGMSVKRFECNQIVPKMFRGIDLGGDGKERPRYRFAVDEFHRIESGIWVPIRVSSTIYASRGPRAGDIHEENVAVVDTENSRWNTSLEDDVFAVDYPPGTRVYNELLSVDIVVGKKPAGKHLDDLLTNAKTVIPASEHGKDVVVAWLARRNKLMDAKAPEIHGIRWINTDSPIKRKALRGKVVLIDFWGTSCSPCIQKLPDTQAIFAKYRDKGLMVIGVHPKDNSKSVDKLLKEKVIEFPNAVDDGRTVSNYHVEIWPTYVLVDRSGMIRSVSFSLPQEQDIENLLKEAPANKTDR